MLVSSQISAGLALYRNQFCSNDSTNYFCNRQFLLELNGGCGLRPQGHQFGDNFFGSTVVNHVFSELFVSYESVVDTQVVLLFALLLE